MSAGRAERRITGIDQEQGTVRRRARGLTLLSGETLLVPLLIAACRGGNATATPGETQTPIIEPSPSASATPTQTPTLELTPSPTATATETLSPREALLTPSLASVASKAGMEVGVEFTGYEFNDSLWRQTVSEQFNLGIIDWGLNWNEIEPSQGQFDFSTANQEIIFAQLNNMEIRGQAIVFPSDLPNWIKNGNFSKAELTDILINHVKTVVGTFKGKVNEWVVVNEPYIYPYRTDDIFYKTIGPDYIDIAFKAAREADPSATLIYNDTFNHSPASAGQNGITTTLTMQTVKRLKSEGLIDAVGLEMHLDASDPPNKQDVTNTMKSYGVPVVVTEFDVDLQKVGGTQAKRYALQAQIASNMVGACRQSGVCKEFTLWGIGDNYSWLEESMGEKNADPTPFDDSLNPKDEYFAIRTALS